MIHHDIEQIKANAIKYLETQNSQISLKTIAKRIGAQRKVVRYVLRTHPDVFKAHQRLIKTNRHVYTL